MPETDLTEPIELLPPAALRTKRSETDEAIAVLVYLAALILLAVSPALVAAAYRAGF